MANTCCIPASKSFGSFAGRTSCRWNPNAIRTSLRWAVIGLVVGAALVAGAILTGGQRATTGSTQAASTVSAADGR